MLKSSFLSALFLVFLVACGSQSSSNNPTSGSLSSAPPADIELLFIGNSHSSANDLPGLVATLVKTGTNGKSVYTYNAPGWSFLDERIGDGVTHATIKSRNWNFVFLQAQKYSTTGLYYYPTDAAEEWVRRVKAVNAIPVMFPEWPRRGNFEEGLRVHQLHESIAQREPACVAPVGLAWDLAVARHPTIVLHASDGNHSALKGTLLTAFVFYEVITENRAEELPYISGINVSEEEQALLAAIATETVEQNPPCIYMQ